MKRGDVFKAFVFDRLRNLVFEFRCGGAVFLAVREKSRVIQLIFADEVVKFLKLLVRFTGKTDDESRANRDVAGVSDFFDKVFDFLLGGPSPHRL